MRDGTSMRATRCRWRKQFLVLLLVLTVLSGCRTPEVTIEPPTIPLSAVPQDANDGGPSVLTRVPATPTPAPEHHVPSTRASPDVTASGETLYLGVNQVQGLIFTADDFLWAATTGGAVHWNLATGSHDQYTVADGLASNYVTDVDQAPDGSLWFAALGGVSRLDEGGWTSYTEADGLVSDAVQTIVVARDGTVWAGTTEGVGRFDGTSWTTYLPGDRAWEIAVAPDGAVWFANDGAGLRRYTPADDAWTTVAVSDGAFAPGVKTVAVGPEGEVWVYLGYDKVYRLVGDRWQPTYDAGGQWVCGAAFEADGRPWIATCDGYRARGAGLATLEDGVWRHIGREEGLASDSVQAVAIGPGGQIAAGTKYGLSLYRDGQWQTLRHGPALNQITTVAVTPDGVAWFGFGDASFPPAGGGVTRFDGQRWEVINQTSGLPINDNVRVLTVDPDGRLWAGAGCELAYRAEGAWHRVAGCEDLHGNVIGIAYDPAGVAWIATDFDVYRFDGQQWATWESLVPTAIAVTQDGDVLLGQSPMGEGGVWAHDGDGWQRLAGSPACVREMAVDGEGTMWAVGCEASALYRRGEDAWDEITAADGLPAGRVADVAVSTTREVWVATEGSIGHLGTAGWVVRERTRAGDVRAMAIAPDGSIWLGTSDGVLHLRP